MVEFRGVKIYIVFVVCDLWQTKRKKLTVKIQKE